MQTYSLSELQANPAFILHQADIDAVLIQLDGRQYEIRALEADARPSVVKRSPLDVPRLKLSEPATIDSILDDIHSGRDRL